MKFDTWLWCATLATVAVVLFTTPPWREDPADTCRAQTLASEERIMNRLWIVGHKAQKDAAALKADIAKLPHLQQVNGLHTHWQTAWRVER